MLSKDLFKEPPKEYRGVPFWSINDELNSEEVARQIGILDEGGFGGVFFHAREGLLTPYMSEGWFRAFESAVKEASRRGMYVWIYDEDRWPSGFASGIVPSLGPEYRAKAIVMIPSGTPMNGPDVVAVYECRTNEVGMPIECGKPSGSGGIYLNFVKYVASIGDQWYGGFSYVDLLNPKVVDKFIEASYEPYVKRFREYIGKVIPGVFTDEPNLVSSRPPLRRPRFIMIARGHPYPIFSLPWTDELPEVFRRLNGYDVVEHLPELFFNIGNYRKVRYDYWRTLTMMFVENFSRRIYEWCSANGLRFTGHYLMEDTLLSQLVVGAVMPHYEYMHVPGMDHLCLRTWEMLLTAKQVASVANQLGKERVLSETYGATGVHPSFEDRKWIGDFLYALGVNLLNHHLVPYSMRGRRKADYGLIIHWGQPWWPYNRLIEDYFARLSYVLSQGVRLVETLVIHPMGSVWATYSPVNEDEARFIDGSFMELLRELVRLHVDFELGDEALLAKYGRVEGGRLIVGRSSYRVVVIPPSYTLSRSTLNLIREFAKAGGLIVAVKPTPTMVDGVESPEVKEALANARVVDSIKQLGDALRDVDWFVKVVGGDGDVLHHVRQVDGQYVVFLANVSRENEHEVEVSVKGMYSVEEWDPFTGEVKDYPAAVSGGSTVIRVRLKPVGSMLLVLRQGVPKVQGGAGRMVKVAEVDLGGEWGIEVLNDNVVVLDYARVKEGDSWSSPMPMPKIADMIANGRLGSGIVLRFELNISSMPKGSVYLVIERIKGIRRVSVNGIDVDLNRPEGHWVDSNFPKYEISRFIKQGLNTIDVELAAPLSLELEPIYVMGRFTVRQRPMAQSEVLGEVPASVKLGDLTSQGFPFYAGSVKLTRKVNVESMHKSAILKIRHRSTLAVVYVNGVEAGKAIGSVDSIDVSRLIRPGENTVEVLLIGHLGNALGPLHRRDAGVCVGPEHYYVVNENWTDDYVLKPFGLLEARLEFYD